MRDSAATPRLGPARSRARSASSPRIAATASTERCTSTRPAWPGSSRSRRTATDGACACRPRRWRARRSRRATSRCVFGKQSSGSPAGVLSGGERSRLELALLAVLPANLLLLDEPTNHLDIPAREALEHFLRETPATVVLVSHDRRLLDAAADRLLVITPLGGRDNEAVRLPSGGGHSAW